MGQQKQQQTTKNHNLANLQLAEFIIN